MIVYFSKKEFKSERSVKNYIGKKFGTHTNFLVLNNFNVDKCVFCDRYADTVVIIKEDEYNWYIDDFTYYRNNKVCRDKECICTKINPQSKEWLMKVKGLSEDVVQKMLNDKCKKSANKQKENGRWDKINNVFSKEYWISRGYSYEETLNILKKKSNKSVNTLRESGYFDDKSNNPFSKEYWIKRGLTIDEVEQKINGRIQNRPEFWLLRGYSEDDSVELSKNSAKRDLKHYIEKYGEDEGRKKYNEKIRIQKEYYNISSIMKRENCSYEDAEKIRCDWILNTHSNCKNSKFSKTSMLFFNKILSIVCLPDYILDKTFYGESEFGHYDSKLKRYYFYDFVIEPLKICIEYNGVVWHPKSPEQDWIQPNTKKTAKEVYYNDLRKKELLEKEGYVYIVVWDDDFEKKIDYIVETIKNKLISYERDRFEKI